MRFCSRGWKLLGTTPRIVGNIPQRVIGRGASKPQPGDVLAPWEPNVYRLAANHFGAPAERNVLVDEGGRTVHVAPLERRTLSTGGVYKHSVPPGPHQFGCRDLSVNGSRV